MRSPGPYPRVDFASRVARGFQSRHGRRARWFRPRAEALEQRLELSGPDGINFSPGTVVKPGQTISVTVQLSGASQSHPVLVFMSYSDLVLYDGGCCFQTNGPITPNPGYDPAPGVGILFTDDFMHTLTFTIEADAPSDSEHPDPTDPSLEAGPFLEVEQASGPVDIPFVVAGTDNLVFAPGGQPTNVATNAPQPEPVIVDADLPTSGSLDANFEGQVTIGLTPGSGTDPGGGTLSAGDGGSLTETAVNGVAKFPGLTVNKAGNGYTLTATSANAVSATSNPFNVGEGLVVNTADDDELSQLPAGMLSLRGAIETVDNNPSMAGSIITFDIPGGGVPDIELTGGPLPDITTSVVIDGTSQPDTGLVEVDGSALSGADGLVITAGDTSVTGLIVVGFNNGIVLQGASDNTIMGDFIGIDPSGGPFVGNSGDGLLIVNSTKNLIGGASDGDGNVISGNGGNGVELQGAGTSGNTVEGNYIGTDADGTGQLSNAGDGVLIDQGASNDLVGGTGSTKDGKISGSGNLISGNGGSGVMIEGQGTGADTVAGNFIGTDVAGTLAMGNGGDGVTIETGASNNYIGGIDTNPGGALAGLGNLISANRGNGIFMTSAGATGNQVEGNYIGTDVTGSVALGNANEGIQVDSGASGNVVGFASTGAGNLISGNGDNGIEFTRGTTTGSNSNTIEGNYIGTDIKGLKSVGNRNSGIRIVESSGNQVGGTGAGTGNLISGNGGDGVTIIGPGNPSSVNPGANVNIVIGDVIGLNLTREASLGNAGNGVAIEQGASGNLIGVDGQGFVAGNIISGNGGDGVLITGLHATLNVVEGNYIGTDATAQKSLPDANGVAIAGGASFNSIGSTARAGSNVISGNSHAGVIITDAGTASNQVVSNLIGTESNTAVSLGNGGPGVLIQNQASGNQIGASGAGNVLSGNIGDGVDITGSGTSSNNIFDNMIGVDAHGNSVPNKGNGVLIQNAANDHVGGTFGGDNQGNTIENNDDDGVVVIGASATGDSVLFNTFAYNGDLPIDLEQGANGGINPPLFTVELLQNGGGLQDNAQVQGTAGTYVVQFYSSPTREADTLQSRTANFVSSVSITLTGDFSNTPLPKPQPGDKYILMTLTNQNGSTSEFSFASINGAHVDQGLHNQGGIEEELKASKSVITVGQTLSVTDIIRINQAANPSVEVARPETSKKGKSKSKITPTGTVYFEDGDTIIGHANVKLVRGVAEAQAKLKLTTPGTQTIYALYYPDAAAVQNGLTAGYTSLTVTVKPAAPKKGHGKTEDVLLGFRV